IAYEQQGRLDEAIACYRQALALNPQMEIAHSNLLMDLHFHGSAPPEEIFAEHRAWAEKFAAPLRSQHKRHTNNRDPDRRLRVGYVSPDFRDHSVAAFIEPILAEHN